jgi:hypothetical protein
VYVTVSQEKWDKSKRYIGDIVEELSRTSELNHKELEKKRGFLIYVTRTYPAMVPYLKGIHQTLETWRPNRDEAGWKRKELREKDPLEAEAHAGGPPKFVKAAPRLAGDLEALQHLTSSVQPPRRRVRSAKTLEVYYGFGDASAMGFMLDMEVEGDLFFRHGHWCDATAEASSNYRELKNLVDGLEELVRSGRVKDAEVFLFTDNSTAEAVFYRGNSTSRPLFELMLRLRKVEMDGGLNLRVIHVAGTRVVEQGTDGGSRGDLTQGVMAGEPMLQYVPLHLTALERSSNLEDWVRSWWDDERGELTKLGPSGWFDEGQREGNFLWCPPPAAAEVVVEQLGEARHKRPQCTHIVIVPRLMTGSWRKGMMKESDIELTIPVGTEVWGKNQHEPLLMYICFPLCRHPPWSLKKTGYMAEFCGELRRVWEAMPRRARSLLRELFVRTRLLQSLSQGVVRRMLSHPDWAGVPDSDSEG